jgi:hypothetical protein
MTVLRWHCSAAIALTGDPWWACSWQKVSTWALLKLNLAISKAGLSSTTSSGFGLKGLSSYMTGNTCQTKP